MPELIIEAAVILSEMEEKSKEMCIISIHVYNDVWDAVIASMKEKDEIAKIDMEYVIIE